MKSAFITFLFTLLVAASVIEGVGVCDVLSRLVGSKIARRTRACFRIGGSAGMEAPTPRPFATWQWFNFGDEIFLRMSSEEVLPKAKIALPKTTQLPAS